MNTIDLSRFCDSDASTSLGKPFAEGQYTYALDGRIVVRVDRNAFPSEENPKAPKICNAPFLKFDHATLSGFEPLPPIDPAKLRPCGLCLGKLQVVTCAQCEGAGEDTEGDECPTCKGAGAIPAAPTTPPSQSRRCPWCEGTGQEAVEWMEINTLLVSTKYLRKIASLPDAKIRCFAEKQEMFFLPPIPFTFDGGVGYVMPMRPTQ
jgi:hypothetical protein